jgi:hypothetical protein
VSLFSGTRLTDRDIDVAIHRKVKTIVMRVVTYTIDEADAVRQLEDLIIKAVNAKTRTMNREGVK